MVGSPSPADLLTYPPEGAGSRPPSGLLDLHKGISDPPLRIPDEITGCRRWPEHQRLLNETTGEVVRGRCKATNLCLYCRTLYVVETAEMLWLDAAEYAPTLWTVLTAREHLTRADTYRHLEQLRRALRRRFPAAEWAVQCELQKRGALHLNLLHKGVDKSDLADVHELLSERWCARVDARPVGQTTRELHDAEGCIGYLAKELAHGLKREQAMPLGWRGHRTSQTRGYLVRSAAVMREEARRSLRLKRELRRAIEDGHQAHDVELIAHQALERKSAESWRLYALNLKRGSETRPVALDAAEGLTRSAL